VKVGAHGVVLSLPFGKGSTPEEVVNFVTKAGIKCLTIPVKSPTWKINLETITNKEISTIKEAIPTSVEVTGLGYCWPSEYNMITDSTTEWKRNLNYVNKLLEAASALGVQHVVIGAPGRSVPSGLSYYDGIKSLVKFWREACANAEDNEVMFCIEHSSIDRSNVGNTTKSLIDLIDAVGSPAFQMIAQIQDMAVNDLDVSGAIRDAGDRIKQVHVADVSGLNPLSEAWSPLLLPGKGVLDFVKIFKALKDIGYDGEICIEAILGEDPASTLSDTRKFLENIWKHA
jgi:sugar phosphate isomerase/epimerase